MSSDSEPILLHRSPPDDLTAVVLDAVSRVQFKLFGLMFLVFLFLSSDTFINRVLTGFSGAVDYKSPTSWGVCIQGLFLVTAMIIIDPLIAHQVI